MIVEDTELDYTDAQRAFTDGFIMNHKVGWDVDVIAGYDFGMVRARSRARLQARKPDDTKIDPRSVRRRRSASRSRPTGTSGPFGMVNALLDFGDDNGWNGYVGGGVGLARSSTVS